MLSTLILVLHLFILSPNTSGSPVNSYDESSSEILKLFHTTQPMTPPPSENTCQLQIQSETFTTRPDVTMVAFAGNAYTYEISCHVNDAKMRTGDKYYIIDLILYGPNMRVQRAWREQFSANNLLKSRQLAINKRVSYRWLGINSFGISN
jgi:hypothetical protein